MEFNCSSYLDLPDSNLSAVRLKLTSSYNYSKNMNCVFTIAAKYKENLMLYFKDMDIESSPLCVKDWLEVYDGLSLDSPIFPFSYVSGNDTLYPKCIIEAALKRVQP